MRLKTLSAKRRPFCLSLNVLMLYHLYQVRSFWLCLLSCSKGDLRCHCAHYDITVMKEEYSDDVWLNKPFWTWTNQTMNSLITPIAHPHRQTCDFFVLYLLDVTTVAQSSEQWSGITSNPMLLPSIMSPELSGSIGETPGYHIGFLRLITERGLLPPEYLYIFWRVAEKKNRIIFDWGCNKPLHMALMSIWGHSLPSPIWWLGTVSVSQVARC